VARVDLHGAASEDVSHVLGNFANRWEAAA